jgi:hypothetical protein
VTPGERAALAAVTATPSLRAPWMWVGLCLALLAVAGAALGWALDQRERASGATARAAELERRADSLAAALEQSRAALAGQPPGDQLAPLLAAADQVVVPLAGAQGAEGRILASEGRGAVLVASGLAALPDGGTYQLWRRTGAVTEPVAALGNAPRGFLLALFSDAAFLDGAESVLVSAEPGPGRPFPTEPAILEGRPPRLGR